MAAGVFTQRALQVVHGHRLMTHFGAFERIMFLTISPGTHAPRKDSDV
jgi:hypothetical protein